MATETRKSTIPTNPGDGFFDKRLHRVNGGVRIIGETNVMGAATDDASWLMRMEIIQDGEIVEVRYASKSFDKIWDDRFTIFSSVFTSGSSLDFDGVDEYVDHSTDALLNITEQLTVSAWVKTSDTTGSRGIASRWLGQGNEQVWFMGKTASAPTKLRVLIGGLGTFGSGESKEYRGSTDITDGAWHHVAFTYIGNTLNLYVDGSLETPTKTIDQSMTKLFSTTVPRVAQGTLFGGSGTPSQFWLGGIDEFSMWNKALSAADITDIYNSGVPNDLFIHSKVSNLVEWWKNGDANGDSIFNINGVVNGIDGTPINMSTDDIVSDTP